MVQVPNDTTATNIEFPKEPPTRYTPELLVELPLPVLPEPGGNTWQAIEGASSPPGLDLEPVERLYLFRGRSEIEKFLINYPFLVSFLQEAYGQIKTYFGESAQLILEVITDPEIAGAQELTIFIRTNLSSDEALQKLEQLDEGWWLDTAIDIREKLCIDIEFE